MNRLLVLALLAAPSLAPAAEPAQSAAPIVAKMQKYYDATKDLHAHFDQQLQSAMGKKKASGEVWLKKPGKMRWDYAKPEKKLMVSDGKTLWVYEPEDEQAFKQDMSASTLPAQVSFLVGESKLEKEFDITVSEPLPGVGGAGEIVLKLAPKTPTSAYNHLVFVVDEKTGQVKETIIFDQTGGQNRLTFTGLEQNKNVDEGKFRFSPPAGTKILAPPKGP
ncbi:MAG TPA: outer membrane lipoprotein chaperone LolA [Polyangia bacterium]|nr:outer membrane lipoprotein chaperone LolA [Polyangia bacterium]